MRAATPCGSTTTRSPWAAAFARTPKAYSSSASCSRRSASRSSTTTCPSSPAPRPACTCSASSARWTSTLPSPIRRSCRPPSGTSSERRGVRLLEVPEEEFACTQATNVLCVAPRRVHHARRAAPSRKSLLEIAGCEVVTIPGEPLSFKAEGGPTCLTRPVLAPGGDERLRGRIAAALSAAERRALAALDSRRPRRLPARARSPSPASTREETPAQRRGGGLDGGRGSRDRRLADRPRRAEPSPRLVSRGRARRGSRASSGGIGEKRGRPGCRRRPPPAATSCSTATSTWCPSATRPPGRRRPGTRPSETAGSTAAAPST